MAPCASPFIATCSTATFHSCKTLQNITVLQIVPSFMTVAGGRGVQTLKSACLKRLGARAQPCKPKSGGRELQVQEATAQWKRLGSMDEGRAARSSTVRCQALPSEEAKEDLVLASTGTDTMQPAENEVKELEAAELQRRKASVASIKDKIVNVLVVFSGLLERPFGSGASMAAAGYVVLERVKSDADSLWDDEEKQQIVFELLRVTKLLTMDMDLVASAQKPQTLLDRLEQAKVHCQQAISLARAL